MSTVITGILLFIIINLITSFFSETISVAKDDHVAETQHWSAFTAVRRMLMAQLQHGVSLWVDQLGNVALLRLKWEVRERRKAQTIPHCRPPFPQNPYLVLSICLRPSPTSLRRSVECTRTDRFLLSYYLRPPPGTRHRHWVGSEMLYVVCASVCERYQENHAIMYPNCCYWLLHK